MPINVITATIPFCHVETKVRDDGIVTTFMVVETNIICNKTNRRMFFYVIILTEPTSKVQNKHTGYTSKHLDAACSYVRGLCRHKQFKG